MSCNFPVGTYRLDGTQTFRPCGTCIACKLGYSKGWALRCVHEASLHEENSFITLTFNDENLPKDLSVHKNELSKFIKRLRRRIEPISIRYFGCGEYGENFLRPHYHVCVFGYDFPDKVAFKQTRRKKSYFDPRKGTDILYVSKTLSKAWKKGFHSIGEFNYNSAAYVARYVTKKISGIEAPNYYGKRNAEFALMSRNPGIGAGYLEKYKSDMYPKDYFVHKGEKVRPPRYYDYLLEKMDNDMLELLKERRRLKAEEKRPVSDIRKMQKEKYRKLITTRLHRSIEK